MLRSFRVANHRSIRAEQDLVLLSAYDQARPVTPVAAVFGANASGKSNLLDALRWMRSAVLDSYRVWEVESGIPRVPFRLDREAAAAPSSFAVDLVIDGVQHTYGFSVDDGVVLEEWLHAYPHHRERVVFERTRQRVELGSTIPERRGRAEVLGSLLRDNALLLSTAVQAKQSEVLPVYRWFRHGLRLGGRQSDLWDSTILVNNVAKAIAEVPSFIDLLRAADLGITAVTAVDLPGKSVILGRLNPGDTVTFLGYGGSDPMPEISSEGGDESVTLQFTGSARELLFSHGESGVPLRWSDQSEGTRAWVRLLVAALVALRHGALFVVDEVDSSLHPRLTARLIELFRNGSTNPRGAQLLFSTHDATLLGTSLGAEVLKRDEIWFVEKRDGATALYPLSDFHPRKGENRERRYLAGSYGAVPVVFEDSLVDSMLATRTEPPDGEA